MYMHDINQDKEEIMMLIHPMMSSADGMKICITNYLGDDYRYIMPDLAGHGDAINQTYKTDVEEAKQIYEYLIAHDIHHIHLAFCASLGGTVLLRLLEYKDITFDHLFFEGASMYESAPFLNFAIRSVYLFLHKRAVKHPEKVKNKLVKMYGDIAGEAMLRRFSGINEESIRNICQSCAYVHIPVLDEDMQSKMVFAYGVKDSDYKHTKKVLPNIYPKAKLLAWEGYGHCEKMTKDSEAYANMLKQYL